MGDVVMYSSERVEQALYKILRMVTGRHDLRITRVYKPGEEAPVFAPRYEPEPSWKNAVKVNVNGKESSFTYDDKTGPQIPHHYRRHLMPGKEWQDMTITERKIALVWAAKHQQNQPPGYHI